MQILDLCQVASDTMCNRDNMSGRVLGRLAELTSQGRNSDN